MGDIGGRAYEGLFCGLDVMVWCGVGGGPEGGFRRYGQCFSTQSTAVPIGLPLVTGIHRPIYIGD